MNGIGLIGLGKWGANYLRVFNGLPNSNVVFCSDLVKSALEEIKRKNKDMKVTNDYGEILEDGNVDAVVVSTPSSTHYKIVKDCLKAGKDVLVEKPFVLDSEEGEELAELAEKEKRILMVGHTFLYNPAVTKLKEYISTGFLGKVHYLYFTRTGLGPIRKDVNAMWDLAPHDISMLLYFVGNSLLEAVAVGQSYLQEGVEDVVFLTLKLEDDVLANVHVSWLDPYKIRKVTVVGSERMVMFDDVNRIEPIRIFNKGVEKYGEKAYGEFGAFQLAIRDGDVVIPKVDTSEPLRNQCVHFLECLEKRTKPLTNGEGAVGVVKVLEAAQESLKSGKAVRIG